MKHGRKPDLLNIAHQLTQTEKQELLNVLTASETTSMILQGQGTDRKVTFYANIPSRVWQLVLDPEREPSKEVQLSYPEMPTLDN